MPETPPAAPPPNVEAKAESPYVIAYYFHGTVRCPTCRKIEAWSREAIEKAFQQQLGTGDLKWRALNVDESENKHFVGDFELYTRSLVLVRIRDGKREAWKNLEKVWDLIGDEQAFKEYVHREVTAYLGEGK
ncbi:MAG: nitrophenyl compound nitroreductase subunit ArsF family protein [Candidatus Eisenbacteria bacterium]